MTFLGSIAAVPLGYRMLRPPEQAPRTLVELADQIRQSAPHLYVVLLRDSMPDEGLYFCERPWPRERLQHLVRARELGHRWQGVVYCERVGRTARIPPEQLVGWGEYGMRIGPLLFFGDPTLLRCIRQAVHTTDGADVEFPIASASVLPFPLI
jgi:hypothetical protein